MVNEKKNIFHAFVVWFIIGFMSAGLCTGLLFSSSEEIRNARTTNSASDIPKRTIDKQNSDVEKTTDGIKQQLTESQSVSNNIGKTANDVEDILRQQNQILRELQSDFRTGVQRIQKKIKQLKAEKTLLYIGLGTVLLIAIS